MYSINDNTLAIITCRKVGGKGDHARNIRSQVAGSQVARVSKSKCNGSTGLNRITVRRSVTVVQSCRDGEKGHFSQRKQQKWSRRMGIHVALEQLVGKRVWEGERKREQWDLRAMLLDCFDMKSEFCSDHGLAGGWRREGGLTIASQPAAEAQLSQAIAESNSIHAGTSLRWWWTLYLRPSNCWKKYPSMPCTCSKYGHSRLEGSNPGVLPKKKISQANKLTGSRTFPNINGMFYMHSTLKPYGNACRQHGPLD